MQLSHLAETLIGSEIVKLGGDIREKIRQGERIYNFTVGDFDPSIFPIPKVLEEGIMMPIASILPITPRRKVISISASPLLPS